MSKAGREQRFATLREDTEDSELMRMVKITEQLIEVGNK